MGNASVSLGVKFLSHFSGDRKAFGYAKAGDAGFDLVYSGNSGFIMEPWDTVTVPTGIALDIPEGYEISIRGRSGLAFKRGIFVPHIGTIDSGFQGEISCLLRWEPHGFIADTGGYESINPGERVAQAILAPVSRGTLHQIDDFSRVTERGETGFGSSGI